DLAASCRSAEPTAREARAQETVADRRHPAHVSPNEVVAVIGGLEQDRALIDAEIVGSDPTMLRIDRARLELCPGVAEARVETVLEAIAAKQPGPFEQGLGAGDHDLRREGE